MNYTYQDKLEAVEAMIESHRDMRTGATNDQTFLLILKSIASDYRAFDKQRGSERIEHMERAIANAAKAKTTVGAYAVGNLREVAELLMGSWPFWKIAAQEFLHREEVHHD
jgi:hypothetical protein